jgi:hypothetical protein
MIDYLLLYRGEGGKVIREMKKNSKKNASLTLTDWQSG